MIRKQITKTVVLVLVGSLVGLLWSCGGGANTSENDDKSVFLQTTVDCEGDYCEVEMVQNLSTTTASVEVCVNSFFSGLDNSVSHVNVTRYELVFERTDAAGSATLPTKTGPLNIALGYRSATAPTCDSFEIPVVSTSDKLYGALADEFYINPATIAEFNCYITVFGRNLAGQNVSAEGAFNIQCAAYLPYDDLIPSIQTFVYDKSVRVGDDWNATWTAFGLIQGGYLTDPFGRTTALFGYDFPVGNYAVNTSYLSPLITTETVSFGTPQLIVGNAFGSTSSNGTDGSDAVDVYPAVPVNQDQVQIEEFFASNYSLVDGQSTDLTWAVFGEPSQLSMSPQSFSGVPVSFEGKDLTFDSVNIVPEASVLPLLYAYKASNFSQDTRALDTPISVTGGINFEDPTIQVFSVSHETASRYSQVAFFWKLTGDYDKVELFPINGVAKDVTGRESFFSPPLSRLGANVFRLIVTGRGGSPIVSQSVTVDVTDEIINQPPAITLLEQDPGTSILNGTSGAFTFQIDDPENQDSTWRVRRIAGDNAVYGPSLGEIPEGHGQETVTFSDGTGNTQGFLTFEITAYDDENYGYSQGTRKSVKLVTYNTTDVPTPDAPTIEDVTFTAGNDGGDDLLPGQDGVISFRVVDPANHRMDWRVEIIAGDRGGTLDGWVDYTGGETGEGGGYVTVHYQDDPDSTDDAVVFKIEASQIGGALSVVYILKVDYMTDGVDVIDFPYIGLHYSAAAIDPLLPNTLVGISERMSFYLNYDQTTGTSFYVDHEKTNPISNTAGLIMVVDLTHGQADTGGTGGGGAKQANKNPERIANVIYERNFITPLTHNENYGEFLFNAYYDAPGGEAGQTTTEPPSDGVSRWYDIFDVNDFSVNASGGPFNLPTVGGDVRDYQIRVRAFDEDNVEESIVVLLQVENVSNVP